MRSTEEARGKLAAETISRINDQGLNYRFAGQPEKALAMFEEAAGRYREKGGGGADETITRLNLGTALIDVGRFGEAERVLQDVYQELLRTAGLKAHITQNCALRLASLSTAQGQPQPAVQLLGQIIATGLETESANPVGVLLARRALGQALLSLGQIDQARLVIQVAMESSGQVGAQRPDLVPHVQLVYAQLLARSGENSAAMTLLAEIIAQQETIPRINWRDTIEGPTALAQLWNAQQNWLEALKYAEMAEAAGRAGSPSGHYLTAAALTEKGRALLGLRRNAEAEMALREARRILDATPGLDPAYEKRLAAVLHERG